MINFVLQNLYRGSFSKNFNEIMEVIGKIIQKLAAQSGVSKSGNSWSKQEYVLETQDAYPKKIFFSFFGERANQFPLEVGQVVRLNFDVDSHEYNGRWFTNINAWKAEQVDPNAAPAPAEAPMSAAPAPTYAGAPATPVAPAAPAPDFSGGGTDDLPF